MAILSPSEMPVVLKARSEELKKYILTKLGYPHIAVEISEDQLEVLIRVVGDFIAGYFPLEERLAVFTTTPLRATYPMPSDAYWIQEVAWNPAITRIDDIFGIESYLFAAGNIGNVQNLLTDYHLLQAYRKSSAKILGYEGHWEVINEVNGDATEQLIRLYPTPKGAFPVVVVYYPVVTQFRSPQAKMLVYDAILAEAKIALGTVRRKLNNMPSPSGGNIGWDGEAMVQEGLKEKEEIIKKAINLGEPMRIFAWNWLLPLLITLTGSLI